MPAPRRRLSRELFETRSHSWYEVGLGEEIEKSSPRRALGGLVLALVALTGTLLVYENRHEWLPGYGPWVKVATVAVLVIVGSVAVHWLVRGLTPRLFRRLDPATAGTLGFLIRLFAMSVVLIAALRIAGVTVATLALGGTITAVVLGLAAQQSLGGIFAGVVLQSTRPFRVGERVRFVGGFIAGSVEGTVSSLGLFYTTLAQGADRIQIPNSVLINLAVVPVREPDRIDVRARFEADASRRRIAAGRGGAEGAAPLARRRGRRERLGRLSAQATAEKRISACSGSGKTSPRTNRPSRTSQSQATGRSRMPCSRLRA